MLTDQLLPLQMNFVIGDSFHLSRALLFAENEVAAMARYGCKQAEGEPQFQPALNLPVRGLIFEPGQGAGCGIKRDQNFAVLEHHFAGQR